MKSVWNSLLVFSSVVLFSGCYTELATVEQNDRGYVSDSDTTYEEGSTAINNHYYLDDNYRRSRLQVSFHYYYPENTSWIGGYYNSYFNDPYWGMRPWSWTYDPWYGYYPSYYPTWGCPPDYYGQPYYHHPHVAHYPMNYPSLGYGTTNPVNPPRIRTDGSTRDGNITGTRSRPMTAPSAETQVTTVTTVRTGRGNEKNVVPVSTPVRTRNNEKSWWDRSNSEQPKEVSPADRPRISRTPNAPGKQIRRSGEATSVERPRTVRKPTNAPSSRQSTPSNESRPVERPRETRRQSYNPPPQSAPTAQAPSRGGSSGGSGSSSSSGGRKRD